MINPAELCTLGHRTVGRILKLQSGAILSRINFCTFSLPQVQRYRFGIHLFSLRCFSLKDGRVLGVPNALREERLETEIRAKTYAQQYSKNTEEKIKGRPSKPPPIEHRES